MPSEDAVRWNSRYLDESGHPTRSPNLLLTENKNLLTSGGLALDIAMGLGVNAGFLLRNGLRVIGVDISYAAVYQAKHEAPGLMAVVVDLEDFFIPPGAFDVILDLLYLQRTLWVPMVNGLKVGGILLVECLTMDMLGHHPDINPSYLLNAGELHQAFHSRPLSDKLEILHSAEGWYQSAASHRRASARLIARRIGQ